MHAQCTCYLFSISHCPFPPALSPSFSTLKTGLDTQSSILVYTLYHIRTRTTTFKERVRAGEYSRIWIWNQRLRIAAQYMQPGEMQKHRVCGRKAKKEEEAEKKEGGGKRRRPRKSLFTPSINYERSAYLFYERKAEERKKGPLFSFLCPKK